MHLRLWLIIAVASAPVGLARGDDREAIDRIVEKAIRAAGGEGNLSRVRAAQWKMKTIVHGPRGTVETTGEYAQQLPEFYRAEVICEAGGKTKRRIVVINRQGRWLHEDGVTRPLPDRALGEVRENNHAISLANNPLQLRRRDLRLTYLGESKVGSRKAVGIRVRGGGYQDVEVDYDAQTGLILRSVMRQRGASGKTGPLETLYSYHHEVEGVVVPFKATSLRDGKAVAEMELFEVHIFPDGLDETVFARP